MKYNLSYHYWKGLYFNFLLGKLKINIKAKAFLLIFHDEIYFRVTAASIDEEKFFTEDTYKGNDSIRKSLCNLRGKN